MAHLWGMPYLPRLLELIYRAVKRFRAPYVIVVSGYRDARATSRHAHGRAADIVLPGVSDRRLAAYFRRQGFVGVGLYPVSGFVHLDVRSRSFFWIDRSGPGRPSRLRPVLRKHTHRMDRRALRRGEAPVEDLAGASDIEAPAPDEDEAIVPQGATEDVADRVGEGASP